MLISPAPQTPVVVGEWHPDYAGRRGVVDRLVDHNATAIVHLMPDPAHPDGDDAAIGVPFLVPETAHDRR